jgi:enolase
MAKISKIFAREVLDSRGNPTVEVEMYSDTDESTLAIVPSGASTGEHEACELRDGDKARFLGKGVLKAVGHVNDILSSDLIGQSLNEQRGFDEALIKADGTEQKSKLGANALLALSMAYAKLSAKVQNEKLYEYFARVSGNKGVTLPAPMMNILNGGAHADNKLDFQEIMVMPVRFPNFKEALRAGTEIFHHLKSLLKEKGLNTSVGDEGGFAPQVSSYDEALSLVAEAVKKSGYKLGEDVFLALDVAASEFYEDSRYQLTDGMGTQAYSGSDLVQVYKHLAEKYPLVSIEDGLDENDWSAWKELTEALGDKLQLVGDDLFVTNTKLLEKGISMGVGNAILIKMNQIGTITETIDCINLAKKSGYNAVISHRSGETEDTTIADLAVGTDAGQIKTGSLCRTDRVAKYNQLLRIEENLGKKAKFANDLFSS